MSTVTLTCSNCKEKFEKDKNEYRRRMAKLPDTPNFFCSRSCNAVYRNKMAGGNSNPTPPPPHPGNDYGQLYPTGTGWYIGRCTQDSRKGKRLTEDRLDFANHIAELFEEQDRRCAISDVLLVQKDPKGKCLTENPFRIASLDRIDNTKGYEIGNVQWTSVAINKARGATPLDVFMLYYKDAIKN